uniref:Uncharacterized protein n=1 Tax=Parascaris equorum TaxID=6256 RepID=A0A914RNV3_PAREQ
MGRFDRCEVSYFEVSSCVEYDFDVENMNDPNAVSMYAADIFKYYASREVDRFLLLECAFLKYAICFMNIVPAAQFEIAHEYRTANVY